MWELGFLQIYLLSLSLIANKSRLGGWDWLPRKGGNDCCLEQKCQFPAWVSKTIKSWEPSLQKRKKGFDWVFLNFVFTYGPCLLFFFFFLFIVIGFLPGTVPPRINLLTHPPLQLWEDVTKPQSWASGMQAEVSHGSCWETSLKIWSEWTPCCLLDHGGWGPVSRGGEWCREESDPKDQGRTASPAWKAELWTHDLPPGVILWVCYITWQNGLGKCS